MHFSQYIKCYIASVKHHWSNVLILFPVSQSLAKVMHFCKTKTFFFFLIHQANVARGLSIIVLSFWIGPINQRNVFLHCGINEYLDRARGSMLSSVNLLSQDSLFAQVLIAKYASFSSTVDSSDFSHLFLPPLNYVILSLAGGF